MLMRTNQNENEEQRDVWLEDIRSWEQRSVQLEDTRQQELQKIAVKQVSRVSKWQWRTKNSAVKGQKIENTEEKSTCVHNDAYSSLWWIIQSAKDSRSVKIEAQSTHSSLFWVWSF